MTEVTLTQPFDVIKTLKQNKMKPEYDLKSLYKGFGPRLYGNIPSLSMFLFSQSYLDSKLNMNEFHNKLFLPMIILVALHQFLIIFLLNIMKIN